MCASDAGFMYAYISTNGGTVQNLTSNMVSIFLARIPPVYLPYFQTFYLRQYTPGPPASNAQSKALTREAPCTIVRDMRMKSSVGTVPLARTKTEKKRLPRAERTRQNFYIRPPQMDIHPKYTITPFQPVDKFLFVLFLFLMLFVPCLALLLSVYL